MKHKFYGRLTLLGGLFLYYAIHSCITGRIYASKGGEYITPETDPLLFWAIAIGSALVGLACIAPTLISFVPAKRREKSSPRSSGVHAVPESQALGEQPEGSSGTPFDPAEKIYEAPDDSVVQVTKDYVLCGDEGKAGAKEEDKIFFKDLTRITVIRSRKSGRTTAIDYKVRRKSGTFEIGGFKPEEMEEIARLLETRAKSWPIQFLEKQISGSNYVALFSSGLGAIAATICSGWLLHFGWTVRDQLSVGLGLLLFVVIFLPTLGVAAFLWFVFWDNLWG